MIVYSYMLFICFINGFMEPCNSTAWLKVKLVVYVIFAWSLQLHAIFNFGIYLTLLFLLPFQTVIWITAVQFYITEYKILLIWLYFSPKQLFVLFSCLQPIASFFFYPTCVRIELQAIDVPPTSVKHGIRTSRLSVLISLSQKNV